MVSGLTRKSLLIHFECTFVYKTVIQFTLLHVTVQCSQYHLLKRLPVPSCIVLPPLSQID